MAELQHGFTCYWIIKNFCIDENVPECKIKSQIFDVPMLIDSTWYLELDHRESKPLALGLHKVGPASKSNINLEMSILMTEREWISVVKGLCQGMSPRAPPRGAPYLIKWHEHTPMKRYLLDGKLTVSCHMSNEETRNRYEQCVMTSRMMSNCTIIHESLQKFTSLKPYDLLNMPLLPLHPTISLMSTKCTQTEDDNVFNDLEDILKLFREKKFRYVTLRTASKDFAVQKALLCARSPVFNAMFQGNMMEDQSNIVDIKDIDCNTLFLLVQFLHLEPIGDLAWDAAIKLYYAADKYQIDLLKKECLYFLRRDLSDKNICDAFVFADAHQDEELQKSAQEYFCKNSRTILRSTEWADLLYNRADLASDILYKLAENL
ncbi:TD and POZ domain-containing protein 3-like [Parasteatoda tepidariorum]|uniref:TD and POZ domain-containing protein 3-like n=1 Tax=Parasteatoda tepidariorum TaxID=114398 RepID=UPI00077F94E9|nr:TD and POZ domain-containing protein 3-like [Parasteatoda tepidariorum]